MKLRKMSVKKLVRTLKQYFDKGFLWDRRGDFVFVHLDEPTQLERNSRIQQFSPTMFFDPGCPHCQPFLNDGAIMVFVDNELIGMRLLPGGTFETVMLRSDSKDLAVAN